jgi:hypothetical protein
MNFRSGRMTPITIDMASDFVGQGDGNSEKIISRFPSDR